MRTISKTYINQNCKIMEDTMFFNWNTLRNMLDEQIKDSKKYGERFAKPYRQVRCLMA